MLTPTRGHLKARFDLIEKERLFLVFLRKDTERMNITKKMGR